MTQPQSVEGHPVVVVYDPADLWSRLGGPLLPVGQGVDLPRGGVQCRVTRLHAGPLPACDLLLSVVPDRVFDRNENAALARARAGQRVFVAPVGANLLADVDRAGLGFEQLLRDVRIGFAAPLLLVIEGAQDALGDGMQVGFQIAHGAAERRALRSEKARLLRAARLLLRRAGTPPADLDTLSSALDDAERAKALGEALRAVDVRIHASEEALAASVVEWGMLADRSRARCLAHARGVKYHGVGAENIVEGVAELLAEVANRLRLDFMSPPTTQLAAWATTLSETVARPASTLPIVGVFSSGKTTLLNHVLGTTPEGHHALLRTSQGHNTALLTHFRLKQPGDANRVVFKWRPRLELDLLRYDDPSELPVCAPAAGVIESIKPDREGGSLVVLRTPSGADQWVTVPSRRRLLPAVRPGASVHYQQALTDGRDLNDQLAAFLHEPTGRVLSARPWAMQSAAQFIEERRIIDVQLHLRWCEPQLLPGHRYPYTWKDEVLPLPGARATNLLEVLRRRVAGREEAKEVLVTIPRSQNQLQPLSVTLRARVRADKCLPAVHNLETDADWDWFQGPAATRSAEAAGPPCFAESPLAAWLVERADVFLDEPLLQLVSLVDTPGLNSISEHHDRITEQVIEDGTAFLVMVRLGRDTRAAATERVLTMISSSLVAHRVAKGDWRDRVFVVLNWHEREPGAQDPTRAAQSANYMRDRLKAMLNAESVRVYVVNLAPARTNDNPEEMLGYPSLGPLKRDLRTLLAARGLGATLSNARRELDRRFAERVEELKNQAIRLGGGQDAAALKRLDAAVASLEPGAPGRMGLLARVSDSIEDVTRPMKSLHAELSREFTAKDDFAQTRDIGPTFMRAYHAARLALVGDVPEALEAAIRQIGRDWVSLPHSIDRPADEVNGLPTLAAEAFGSDAAKVISEWPGIFGRAFHLIFNWKYHCTTERDKLRERYMNGTTLAAIEKTAGKAGDVLMESVNRRCDELLAALKQRRMDSVAGAAERETRLEEIEREQLGLTEFEAKVAKMLKLLRDCVDKLEGKK